MNSDSYFCIGSSHKYCEDYAIHGDLSDNDKTLSYALISDGCSSSLVSKGIRNPINVDIGNRLIALEIKNEISSIFKNFNDDVREKWINIFLQNLNNTNLYEVLLKNKIDDQIFDCTVLLSIVLGDKIYIRILGDGVIAVKNKSGILDILNLEYDNNAPMYYSYLMNKVRLDKFEEVSKLKITRTSISDSIELKEEYECKTNDIIIKYNTDEISSISLFSDGVKTFRDKEGKEINYIEIVKQLTDFKNKNGEFVKKQLNIFNRNNKELLHSDDFSFSAIII